MCSTGPSPGAQPVPMQLAFCRLCAGSGRALGQGEEAGGPVPVPHSPAPKRFPEAPPRRAGRVSRGRGEVGGWHSPAVEPHLVFFAPAPQEAPVSRTLCSRHETDTHTACPPLPWIHGTPFPTPRSGCPLAPLGSSQTLASHLWLFPCPGASAPPTHRVDIGQFSHLCPLQDTAPSFRASPEGTIVHRPLIFRRCSQLAGPELSFLHHQEALHMA